MLALGCPGKFGVNGVARIGRAQEKDAARLFGKVASALNDNPNVAVPMFIASGSAAADCYLQVPPPPQLGVRGGDGN